MLTPLELDIMKAVWRQPSITVREVREEIRPARNLAYTTVMTIMDRLYRKGCLKRVLKSRAHYYEPAIDYTDVRDEALDSLIRNFFGSKEKLQEFLRSEPEEEDTDELPKITAEPVATSRLDETLL
jgi:predicted transcriptional regulator